MAIKTDRICILLAPKYPPGGLFLNAGSSQTYVSASKSKPMLVFI